MKAYLGLKKTPDKHSYVYGLNIYSNDGTPLFSATKRADILTGKFSNQLDILEWGIKRMKTLTQNKRLPEERITIFINSKTIYSWFEEEVAPEPYLVTFSDMLLEMSFLVNELEIIHTYNKTNKVTYKNSDEQETIKITDMFG